MISSFVLCVRDISLVEDEFGKSIGSVSYLEIPNNEETPRPSHVTKGVEEWFEKIVTQANPSNDKSCEKMDIVFFVHGYNTSPEEALVRQRLVEKELQSRNFKCIVIGFDWPTAGSPLTYLYDRSEASDTASMLVKGGIIPFIKYSAINCPINIHLIAHSMGGFVVREAFREVDKYHNANLANDWRIGQMVLFAADISSECFELDHPDMLPVFNHCGRLTNYFSGYDKALAASNVKNIDISSRVGRVGMPVDTPAHEKAIDIDCGARYNIDRADFKVIHGMVSHSWYLEDAIWYDDLAYTLKGEIDRNSIPTRMRVGINDFVLIKEQTNEN